jgi:hypothetical protein
VGEGPTRIVVRFDSWRAERSGNRPGRNLATKSTERWASVRRPPVPVEGSEYVIECSTVIAAIGQAVDRSLAESEGRRVTGWGIAAGEPLGFTAIGRGFDVAVAAPFGRPLSEALQKVALRGAEACPSGALALRCAPQSPLQIGCADRCPPRGRPKQIGRGKTTGGAELQARVGYIRPLHTGLALFSSPFRRSPASWPAPGPERSWSPGRSPVR